MSEFVLEMINISKTFPGVKALDNVELRVKKGTVHALLGENGAGKSTLMKILMGVFQPDSGTIVFQDEKRVFLNPHEAISSGIAMIHQELSAVMELTIAENIFLGKEITLGKTIFTRKRLMQKRAKELLKSLEINIDPGVKIKNLSVANQQICEIAKAISYNADLLIMDEPTSAITEAEVEHLFRIINKLKEDGISIIYITHKMDEVFKISDEITIYRDGKYIDTKLTKETTHDEIVTKMVGRELSNFFAKEQANIGEVIFKVENLTRNEEFKDISFDLRSGEILGVFGLMGSGRSEIMETLFGVRKKTGGDIYIKGIKIDIKAPRQAIRKKIAFVTEDRKRSGCFLPLNILINTYIASIDNYTRFGFVKHNAAKNSVAEMKEKLNIRTPSLKQIILNLSGGNQQKVLVARWLLTDPDIFLIDEPTRGIDVGAKSEIYKIINGMAKQGKGIIMVSSEMPEIIGICDRVMIICQGRKTGVLSRDEITQEKLLRYATGLEH